MTTSGVRLVRSDAYILAAVTEQWLSGSTQKLQEFAHDYDWLNRALPTFDELSFGLARLVAAGYVTTERIPNKVLRLKATPSATALGKQVREKAKTLGDVVTGFDEALGCRPYPEAESDDRSLGRLSDFSEAEWAKAVTVYDEWFERTERRIQPVMRILEPVIGVIVRVWRLFRPR